MIANSIELWEIGRATLLVSVSTLLLAGLWRWQNPTAPALVRLACLLILVQGWFIYRLPISAPWYDAPVKQPAAVVQLSANEATPLPQSRVATAGRQPELVAAPPVRSWRRPTLKELTLLVWLAGPLVLLGVFVRDFRRFFARVVGAQAAPEEWLEQWRSVCQAAGVQTTIPMRTTVDIGPLLCWNAGYRLLVPMDYWSGLTIEQREGVLRHELAHYERGDIWKSLLVRLMALPQWFNPCVWRLIRWFDEGAEHACDRAVVRSAPHLASDYARALLSLGRTPNRTFSFASSVSGSTLSRRIRQIVAANQGDESAAKRLLLLTLPMLLTTAGMIRVELVAKEPPAADRPPVGDAKTSAVSAKAEVRLLEMSNDAWFIMAASKLAVEADPRVSGLTERLEIYHGVAARDWKDADLAELSAEWARATRGEKIDGLPMAVQDSISGRKRRQPFLTEQERQRQSDLDRSAFEVMKSAVAFQQQGDVASAYWRRQIESDPQHANDYRWIYLASIAREGAQPIDLTLAEPLIPNPLPSGSREFVALCEILRTFAIQKQFDGNDVTRLRRQLRDVISKESANGAFFASLGYQSARDVQLALERLYQSYRDARRGGEAEEILRTLIAADPRGFENFAVRFNVPPRERRQWHMDRVVRFSLADIPLNKAIDKMLGSVVLPCWIDDALARDETPVSLDANGPWIDTLRRLLATTKYELRFLNEEVMWIGPPAQRQPAEMLLGRALLRMPAGDAPIAVLLRKPISFDFAQTPIEDVLAFLADFLRVNLLPLAKEKSISLNLTSLPTYLALSLMCARLELDWCVEEGVVVVGSAQQVEAVQERGARYRRRAFDLERRATAGSSTAKSLLQPISFDFIVTPLTDVNEFLRDYSKVTFVAAPDVSRDTTIILQVEQVPLAWSLELMLMQHDLHWEVLDKVVFIGSDAQVGAAKSKMQERLASREGYPRSLRAELGKDIRIEAKNAPLFAVAESLAKTVRVPIEANENVRHRKVTFHAEPMPFDIALDLMCQLNQLSWRMTQAGAIQIE